jgi:hypothetical protein
MACQEQPGGFFFTLLVDHDDVVAVAGVIVDDDDVVAFATIIAGAEAAVTKLASANPAGADAREFESKPARPAAPTAPIAAPVVATIAAPVMATVVAAVLAVIAVFAVVIAILAMAVVILAVVIAIFAITVVILAVLLVALMFMRDVLGVLVLGFPGVVAGMIEGDGVGVALRLAAVRLIRLVSARTAGGILGLGRQRAEGKKHSRGESRCQRDTSFGTHI